jgi:predicted HAD superfamily Cof-like phosphohydrolase
MEAWMTNFEKVGEFRKKLKLPMSGVPTFLSPEETSYFARFILEELSEYMRACEEQDLTSAADGLADLMYVTLGCAHAMGLPFDEIFDVVHKCNMQKVPASDEWRSLRGKQYDVVKPPGFTGPEWEISILIKASQGI